MRLPQPNVGGREGRERTGEGKGEEREGKDKEPPNI